MGLFGIGGKGGKPKRHWRPGTPAERMERAKIREQQAKAKLIGQDAEYLAWLKANDPVKWQSTMDRRMGIASEGDRVDEFMRTFEQFKKMGLVKRPQDLDDSNLLTDLAPAIAAIAQAWMSSRQAPAIAQPNPNGSVHVDTPVAVPSLLHPSLSSPTPALPNSSVAVADERELSSLSRYLIFEMREKSPEQAARWLLAQRHMPQFVPVLEVLVRTPDADLPETVERFGRDNPSLWGFVSWLLEEQRWPWFLETVTLIRRQVETGG